MTEETNPFLKRMAKRSTGHHGNVAERKAAKAMKGDLVKGSGAVKGRKGDIKKASAHLKFLIESKSTIHETFSMRREWLEKISNEALCVGKRPALVFQFVDPQGNVQRPGRFVAVSEAMFMEMLELIEEKHGVSLP